MWCAAADEGCAWEGSEAARAAHEAECPLARLLKRFEIEQQLCVCFADVLVGRCRFASPTMPNHAQPAQPCNMPTRQPELTGSCVQRWAWLTAGLGLFSAGAICDLFILCSRFQLAPLYRGDRSGRQVRGVAAGRAFMVR